jgi:hypothetical protein
MPLNLVTWNMQGATGFGENKWRTDVTRLFRAGAQVVLLQECGNPPNSAGPVAVPPPFLGGAGVPGGMNWSYLAWSIGSRRHPCDIGIYWVETDPGGHRCNLAIATVVFAAVPGAVIPGNLICVPPPAVGPGQRPAIGIRVPYGGGNIDLYTLHAISPGGPNAPGLLANINVVGPPWLAAGDYNRAPATWGGGGGVLPAGAVVSNHNGDATHPGSGTNLDYAINRPGGAVPGQVMDNFVVSDHYPVYYAVP